MAGILGRLFNRWTRKRNDLIVEFLRLARRGSAEASTVLGFMHAYGDVVLQDYPEAVKWF